MNKTVPESLNEHLMEDTRFHVGDHVKYCPTHNKRGPMSTGTIQQVRTSGGKATSMDPRYIIKNDHTDRENSYSNRSIVEKLD